MNMTIERRTEQSRHMLDFGKSFELINVEGDGLSLRTIMSLPDNTGPSSAAFIAFAEMCGNRYVWPMDDGGRVTPSSVPFDQAQMRAFFAEALVIHRQPHPV